MCGYFTILHLYYADTFPRNGSISKSEMNIFVRQETDRMSIQIKNFYELQIKDVLDRITSLEENSAEKSKKISELETDNEKMRDELRNAKPKKEINIGKPSDSRPPKAEF